MDIACDAIMLLGRRYEALAREMAEAEVDPARKAELLQIAENCAVVPAHAPRTYWQAIQMYWFVHLGVTTELNPWDAYSPGRLDQHLYPFYKADTDAGALTGERALELLECLWVKFNNQPAPPKVGITLKESSTYTDFANINTGGIAPDGSDGVNDVSYLILDCMDEMRLLQPSSNVQISRKTPRHFLKRACEISRKGWGQPAFYNTDSIVQELVNAGKTLEDARKGGTSGCVETGAFGNEAYILNGYFNIPKVLELTMNDGVDPRTGKQLGLKLGKAEDFADFESLYQAFEQQMKHLIDIKVRGSNVIEQIYARAARVVVEALRNAVVGDDREEWRGHVARINHRAHDVRAPARPLADRAQRLHRALVHGEVGVRHHQLGVHLHARAEAGALGAHPLALHRLGDQAYLRAGDW
jgi:formate C-acetyltransferase